MIEYGHYTDVHGLLGIVTNRSLWATNVRYLNDEQEYENAFQLLRGLQQNFAFSLEYIPGANVTEFLEAARIELENTNSFKGQGHNLYTISFSTETDLLSQWRGYCPDNNGYCIVFDAKRIYKLAAKNAIGTRFVACIYNDAKKEKLLQKAFSSSWREFASVEDEQKRLEIVNELAVNILELASHFKNSSFAEEKEFRIVIDPSLDFNNPTISFRCGRSSLVPYIAVPAPVECIKRIVIGPTVNPTLAVRAVQELLYQAVPPKLAGRIRVDSSKAPYRNW